mgnify:CR=1 FL=1
MRSLVTKLTLFLNAGGKNKARAIEEYAVELIEEFLEEDLFISLPTN